MQQLPITRRGLPDTWTSRSDAYAWRSTAAVMVPLLALLVFAPMVWRSASWALVLVVPLLGAHIYKLTIVLHDCAHGSLFSSRVTNRAVGGVCAALVGTDLESFARLHWQHHRQYGMSDDPQGSDYLGLRDATRRQLVWHILKPLVGANLVKLTQFAGEAGRVTERRAAITRWRPIVHVGAAQLAVAAIATGFGRVPVLVVLYPFAAATFALFFSQLRGFAEHVAPPTSEEESHARTHLPRLIDRTFVYCLNFNYHLEHHLFPDVPSCRLPVVHDAVKAEWHDERSLSPSIWSTVRDRLAQAR